MCEIPGCLTCSRPVTAGQLRPRPGAGLVGWQRCPVCRGKGIVTRGFYLPPGFPLVPNGLTVEVCRSCNGEGIIR